EPFALSARFADGVLHGGTELPSGRSRSCSLNSVLSGSRQCGLQGGEAAETRKTSVEMSALLVGGPICGASCSQLAQHRIGRGAPRGCAAWLPEAAQQLTKHGMAWRVHRRSSSCSESRFRNFEHRESTVLGDTVSPYNRFSESAISTAGTPSSFARRRYRS